MEEKIQKALNQLTDEEVDDLLLERAKYRLEKYPVIKLNEEMSYRCVEAKTYVKHLGKGYFLQIKDVDDSISDKWWDVTDLTELKVWEYNKLVDELNKHYPDYPIEHLEGRFV